MVRMEETIKLIQEIIYSIRIQNFHEGSLKFQIFLKMIPEILNLSKIEGCFEEDFREILYALKNALEKEDMILLADLFEEGVIPLLKNWDEREEDCAFGEYYLENTSSGYRTLKNTRKELYLHTNVNPMEEARILIEHCYDSCKEEYAVWGCGLGYHILRLYQAARKSIKIKVFEEDLELLNYMKKYDLIKEISKEDIEVIWDGNGEKFADYIQKSNVGILIHYPSVKKIKNDKLREIMLDFFADWNGTIQYRKELDINFRKNIVNCLHNVDELKDKIQGEDVIIVGGGPSLDYFGKENLQCLRKNKKIMATTTVLKKLLKWNVVPDYVVVMDSQERMWNHVKGIEDCEVPLITDSTAYWRLVERYQGEKYIVYQRGYEKAEKRAKQMGNEVYETGGSVVTLALDTALRLGVKRIYLLGVDLAYPEGISHAKDTMDRQKRDVKGYIMTEAISGDMVPTDRLFNSYRKWIEAKIKEYPEIPIYNLSLYGARIDGCKKWILKEQGDC